MGRRESGKKEDRRERRGKRPGYSTPTPFSPSATSLSACTVFALPVGTCSPGPSCSKAE